MTAAIRLSGDPPGRGNFAVPSRSMPGVLHTIFWITEGTAHCTCPGFSHRTTCRHLQAVAHAIEVEARQLVENATPEQRAEAASRLAQIEREFA